MTDTAAPVPDVRPQVPLNDLRRQADLLGDALSAATEAVVRSGWYVLGPRVRAFEAGFADYCGVRHCVGVANGTDALELAVRAAGCGPGDEVVCVANAGMYAAAAVLAAGARPVLADIDPATLTLAPAALARAVSERTRAVIVTHLYGRLADMTAIDDVLSGRGIAVIEDCAQAHGAVRGGRRAGAFGLAGCFSFYPTKNLGALGDGGAIVTDDDQFAASVRELRQYGWTSKYRAERSGGRNSRLDEIQAAALAVKLPHLDSWNGRRRAIAERYRAALPPGLAMVAGGPDHVAHLCVVRTTARGALQAHLQGDGIASEIHYPVADHRQPALAGLVSAGPLPETERATAEVLTVPCFPEMTEDEVERVAASLARFRFG